MKSPLVWAHSVFLGILLIAGAATSARAADWPPISPEDMAMTSVPNQPGAAAVILLRQETDDDLLHYKSVFVRVKILTEAGRKYADVEIPYNRHHSGIAEVSGRTVHADGSIVPLHGKPMDKVILKKHGLQIYVKSFNLPDAQVGSILDYRYEFHYGDDTLYAPEWLVQSDLFEKHVSFKFIPYEKEWEHNGRVGQGVAWTHFLPKGQEPQLHTSVRNSFGQSVNPDFVDLEMNDVPAFVSEPYMPPPSELKWRVEFYYRSSSKPQDFWKEEGKSWNKDVDGFLGRKKGVEQAVSEIVAGATTPDDKVFKIYYFVSRLDNQSYEPARPVQETQALGIKPIRGAEDVLEQKSGDHDELNRLFVAMVHAAGIPAWLMRVPDHTQEFFQPEFLSTDQFDAEIAIVELNGKEVFLDPGTKYCPYGLLEWRYAGVEGQRQSAKGTEISAAPLSTYKDAIIQRFAKLQLTEHGTVEGTLTVGFYGLEAMNRRQEGSQTDDQGRKKMLEDEVRSWLPGGSEVTLTSIPSWQNTVAPLVADFKISSPLATSAGHRWIVPVHVLQVNETPMFAASTRQNAILFDYASDEIDEVHITIPTGMEVESLPANDKVLMTTYAEYVTTQKQESSNGILALRQLALGTPWFKPAEYKDVKDFYDKVKAGDDQPAVLKSAAHAAGN